MCVRPLGANMPGTCDCDRGYWKVASRKRDNGGQVCVDRSQSQLCTWLDRLDFTGNFF